MGENPIAARSKKRLADALMDMMRDEPLDGITITRLCSRAGLSRPAFYQNFKCMDELLERCVLERLYSSIESGAHEGAADFADACADIVQDNMELLALVASQGRSALAASCLATAIGELHALMSRPAAGPDPKSRLSLEFVYGGAARVLLRWTSPDGGASREDVVGCIRDISGSVLAI